VKGEKVLSIVGTAVGAGALGHSLYKTRDLERRVKAIEAALAELGVGPPVGWVDQVDKKLEELQAKDAEIQSALASLQSAVAGLQTYASTIHSVAHDCAGELDDMAGKVKAMANEIRAKKLVHLYGIAGKLDALSDELHEMARKLRRL